MTVDKTLPFHQHREVTPAFLCRGWKLGKVFLDLLLGQTFKITAFPQAQSLELPLCENFLGCLTPLKRLIDLLRY